MVHKTAPTLPPDGPPSKDTNLAAGLFQQLVKKVDVFCWVTSIGEV